MSTKATYVRTDKPGVYRRGTTICYVVRDLDGRQRWRTRNPETGQPFKDEKAAAKARAAEMTDRDRGTFTEPTKLTLGKHLDEWLLGLEAEDPPLSPNTIDLRRIHVRAYIKPHLGAVPLQRLDLPQVKKWRAKLAASGGQGGRPLSRTTVAGAARTLYTALEAAVEAGVIPRNPAKAQSKRGRKQAEQRQAPKAWTAEELQGFLASTAVGGAQPGSALACAQRLHPLWVLAADSGARREELLYLRRHHLDAGMVTIEGGRTAFGGVVREGTTKTGKVRRVRLDPATVAILDGWLKRLEAEEQEAKNLGLKYADDGYLFCDELGVPLHPTTVSRWFDKAVAAVGVTRITVHGLRHSCATLLLEAGVSEHAVADRLGHDNVNTTRLIYQRSTNVMADQAAATIGAIVHGGKRLRAVG